MVRSVTGLFFLTSIAAFAQTADPPAFEVASIRPGEPGKEVIEQVPGSLSMRHVRLGRSRSLLAALRSPPSHRIALNSKQEDDQP